MQLSLKCCGWRAVLKIPEIHPKLHARRDNASRAHHDCDDVTCMRYAYPMLQNTTMPNVMLYIVSYRQYIDEKKVLVQNIPSFFQNKKICLFSLPNSTKSHTQLQNSHFSKWFLNKKCLLGHWKPSIVPYCLLWSLYTKLIC